MNNELPIKIFLSSELIFKSHNPSIRKNTELKSLHRIIKKDDFLSTYNQAIRYVFLNFLDKGYDVFPGKVHTSFKEYCIHVLKFEKDKVLSIVKARHELKYFGRKANKNIVNDLYSITVLLQTPYNQKR